MPSADDYRELADKCFKSARVAHTEDERMMYLGEEAEKGRFATTGARQRGAVRIEAGVTYRRFPYTWL